MTDIIRTWAYLQTAFADTNPNGGILPSMMRDFMASVLSTAPVAAAGSNQGSAAALLSVINVVTPVSVGQGVILNASIPTAIMNRGVNSVKIYPPSGGQIESLGTNTAFILPVGQDAFFVFTSGTQAYVSAYLNLAALPTSLPTASGLPWLDGNLIAVS